MEVLYYDSGVVEWGFEFWMEEDWDFAEGVEGAEIAGCGPGVYVFDEGVEAEGGGGDAAFAGEGGGWGYEEFEEGEWGHGMDGCMGG